MTCCRVTLDVNAAAASDSAGLAWEREPTTALGLRHSSRVKERPTPLADLLAAARDTDPTDRIEWRDPIASCGAEAIDAMVDWIGDPRLAAFAVRVLGKIGQAGDLRAAVVEVLSAVDRRRELTEQVGRDLDWTLASLGYVPRGIGRRSGGSTNLSRPVGRRGRPGRGYWVMRTSPWERAFLWSEARAGRLRQGWASVDAQNLEIVAAIIRRGAPLDEDQQATRRALRMLTSWENGMRVDDLIVSPNLPDYGKVAIFRINGSYRWDPVAPHGFGERFGHVLPVVLVADPIARNSPEVSDGLRAILRVQPRLYNVNGYGGDVERLVGGSVFANRSGEHWTADEFELLFGRCPPDRERPTERDIQEIAAELGRTPGAISWQWEDGASYVAKRSASTTSEPLKTWLGNRVATNYDGHA